MYKRQHGFSASDAINRNKVALCERNRIRTVLKYFPTHLLPAWLLHELGSLLWPRAAWQWAIPWRSWGWNAAHLASTWRLRRRFAPQRGRFESLLAPTWGSYPPPRPTNHLTPPPALAAAGATIAFDDGAAPQLGYGWYPVEVDGAQPMRWTAAAAAAFVRVPAATTRLACTWRAARGDQEVRLRLRRLDDLQAVWEWSEVPGTAWNDVGTACVVPAGAYELHILSSPAAGDSAGRELGVGVARLALT